MRNIAKSWVAVLAGALATAQAPVVTTRSFQAVQMAHDLARQRLVLALHSGQIEEWDGQNWAERGAQLPGEASDAFYDPVRGQVIFVVTGRMFAFDGHVLVDVGPAPLLSHIVADTARNRLVAIAAVVQGAMRSLQVLEWNGSAWQLASSLAGPLRIVMSAAFDVQRGVTVANVLSVMPLQTETWEWDGSTLAQRATGPSPGWQAFVYDPVRRQVLAIGNGTSAWDGVAWTPLPSRQPPTPAVLAADPVSRTVWLYPGSGTTEEGLWGWDGTVWSPRVRAPHPRRSGFGFSFDAARGKAVLFGGQFGAVSADLSEWNGRDWVLAASGGAPARALQGQAYDAARGETVVFGGASSTDPAATLFGDTWVWNGANWRQAASGGPSPRRGAMMTFDSGRSRVVLVGGEDASGPQSDHWEWDGQVWSLIAAATPVGTTTGAIGYDPARARTVVVASSSGTFEYDGANWLQVATNGPFATAATRLTWDPTRQSLQGILFATPSFQFERQEWNGLQWSSLGALNGELLFDAARGRMLAYTGEDLRVLTPTPAVASDYGVSCQPPSMATATSLSAYRRPVVGDVAFHLDVRADGGLRPAAIGLGLSQASMPLGNGCLLRVGQGLQTLLWFTDAAGMVHQRLSLPDHLSLRGLAVFAQAAVLDPRAPGGFTMSQGVRLDLGD